MHRVLAIFAHPDDESFGPGGTLALWARQGAEIHSLCVTCGDAGRNHTKFDTAQVRCRELRCAAKVLGIKKVSFLRFQDGKLSNADLPSLMKKISRHVRLFQPDTLLTFDLNGVSGHIDHIVVASAVSKVFHDAKLVPALYFFTLPIELAQRMMNYFVYVPKGKKRNEVDEIIDVSSVWETKITAINQHQTQKKDIQEMLAKTSDLPKVEYFMVSRI